MLNMRKLIGIIGISCLISFILIISFFIMVSDESSPATLAATFLFVLIFAAAFIISHILGQRSIQLFIFGYFALMTFCILTAVFVGIFKIEYNTFLLLCSLVMSPFYGLLYITDNCLPISFAVSIIMLAVSGFFSFKNNNSR